MLWRSYEGALVLQVRGVRVAFEGEHARQCVRPKAALSKTPPWDLHGGRCNQSSSPPSVRPAIMGNRLESLLPDTTTSPFGLSRRRSPFCRRTQRATAFLYRTPPQFAVTIL